MGGAAVQIMGSLDARRLEEPRGFFAKLFRSRPPREFSVGRDRTMIDLPCKDLRILEVEFQNFLRAELPSPWLASKSVLDYLGTGTTDIHLRGERQDGGEASWYVQVTFSGCAGLAQTSADIAAHWADIWFQRHRDQIGALLQLRGFTPTGVEPVTEEQTYLPIGESGYAGFSREGWGPKDEVPTHFSFDAAVNETNDAEAQRLSAQLESKFRRLMSDGRCRCQLCEPAFDCSVLAGLPMAGIDGAA